MSKLLASSIAAVPRFAAAGILLVVIGAFGAWATVSVGGLGVSVSKAGLDGDGVMTLVLGLSAAGTVAAAHLRPARWQRWVLVPCAVLVVLIAVVDVLDVAGTGEGAVDVTVGWGLWTTLLGGGMLAADAVRRVRA